MKRNQLFLAVAAALGSAAVGCGDNSRQCGEGTEDINGVCTGVDNPDPVVCTDGTMLNEAGTGCVIDPSACQDGTVLVDNACVDPGHLTPTITEAAEPNGLGLFGEVSPPEGAGSIAIPAIGSPAFVIKGTIAPFQDLIGGFDMLGNPTADGQLDVDVDSYVIETTGPALIDVTADGLHGLAAGFVALNDGGIPELDIWQRFGINVNADTSKRQLYIPAAGTYILAVADTRSLFLTGAAAGADEGKPAFEYYISITQQAIAPTTVTITDNLGSATGEVNPGEVKFFTAAGLGEGISDVEWSAPAEQFIESLVITNTSGGVSTLKTVEDGDVGDFSAVASVLGIRAADTPLFVADHVFNYASQPVEFDLTIISRDAAALSTNGQTATLPVKQLPFDSFDNLQGFYYDVATDGEITGMDISFNQPVAGVIVDENLFIFSFFTFDPFFGFSFEETWQEYKGLLRHQTAGRYYFFVAVPSDVTTPLPDLVATSSYGPLTPVAVTKGTPTAAQTPTAFESNPFTYAADVNTDAWQQFNATGTNTGTITLTHFNPAEINPNNPGFGFGRLDFLDSECGAFCDDTFPIRTTTHAENGSTAAGRILLDDGTQTYLIIANTATVAGASFTLDFARRDHVDFGTLAQGASATRDDVSLATTQRFLVRTAAGNGVQFTATPNEVTTDSRIQRVNNDETARGGLVNNGLIGLPDTAQVIQSGEGWTAFQVSALVAGGTADIAVNALAPVTYTNASGTTTFDDACVGGAPIVLAEGDLDEGRSVLINTPAGFDYFGFPAPQIRVFTNGFASVDPGVGAGCGAAFDCFFANQTMPNTANPNGVMAPYWDDIDARASASGSICTKVVGTKLIVQWKGRRFNVVADRLSFQLILDGSNDTVEFVYDVAANQVPTGASGSIGIEDPAGSAANVVGVNTANSIAPATSELFTPN